jgi:hypothetical protein
VRILTLLDRTRRRADKYFVADHFVDAATGLQLSKPQNFMEPRARAAQLHARQTHLVS